MPNQREKTRYRMGGWAALTFGLATMVMGVSNVIAQQPGPLFRVNAQGVQGVGPGEWPRGTTVEIHVSPSGSDTTGDGTPGNPYLTINRSLQDIPAFVAQHYLIQLAPGTYREEVVIENRMFASGTRTNFNRASIELRGDPAAPDSYVLSGADAGAPTQAVRDYVVSCSFSNCILNGVSLQYGLVAGLQMEGGMASVHASTFRNFTSPNAVAINLVNHAFLELRGNSTISNAYWGLSADIYSSVFAHRAATGGEILHVGFPESTNFTITGITGGAAIAISNYSSVDISNSLTLSGSGLAGSKGIWVVDHSNFDVETISVSDFQTAVEVDVFSRAEMNVASFTNATTGLFVRQNSAVDFLTADPTWTNVTTRYDLAQGSRVSFPTAPTLFDGSLESTGAITLAAGGTNKDITLTPSGSGRTILNGWVGMGTPSPSASLHLRDTSLAEIRLEGPSSMQSKWTTGGASMQFGSIGSIPLLVLTGNAERLRVDTSGNLGVGKSAGITKKVDVDGAMTASLNSLSFSSTPTFNASLGNAHKITLTGNVASSTLSNASAGQWLFFIICQDSTGNRTFTWPSNVKGGMTIGSAASTCSAQSFVFDGTNAYALSTGVTNQ